jgi:outer membrane protein OmpU
MKPALLGTTALIGAGLVGLGWAAQPAAADSPIKLTVGGFFREAYMFVSDDDDGGGPFGAGQEPGDNHAEHAFFNDAEVHFSGRTVLDNGLEVGARIELEGENDDDQIDEAWVYFAGGFGEIRIGSDDEALSNSCILPPGGTANFSAFSPNQWGANAFNAISPFFGLFGSVTNSACTGVDDKSDAQKIIYFSPVFAGFQLSASYTPNPGSEDHVDGVGPHVGMPGKVNGFFDAEADSDASVYLTYTYDGSNWGLTWGGGASWEMGKSSTDSRDFHDQDFYQTGLTVYIDRFSIGGVFEYYNDIGFPGEAPFQSKVGDFGVDIDAWVAGGGMAYTYNAWTFGAQYSYRKDTFRENSGTFHETRSQVQQRAVATVNYVLGTGINLDGEVAYTWRDQNPEAFSTISNNDDYDAIELGIGTAISF